MSERGIRRAHERELSRRTRRKRRRPAAAAAILGAAATVALVAPGGADAATFEVNSLADGGPDGCAVGTCTLRDAVSDAGLAAGGDTITFAPALSGQIRLTSTALRVNGTDPLTIIGPGAAQLSLSGDRNNNGVHDPYQLCGGGDSRIFVLQGSNPANPQAVSISGLTLTDGVAGNYGAGVLEDGGAIRSRDTNLTITDAVFDDNLAQRFGGAISADQLQLVNTTVSNNQAYSGGGGIDIKGTAGSSALSASSITGNRAGGDSLGRYTANPQGGGIRITGSAAATLDGLEIADNKSAFTRNPGPTQLVYGTGGGLALGSGGTITATDLTISGNEALAEGGGAWITDQAEIARSTVSDNQAGEGGGVFTDAGKITNSTITGNDAVGAGGGVSALINTGDAPVPIRSSTIAGNTALGSGGGLFAQSPTAAAPFARLTSTIVAENTSSDDLDVAAGTPGGTPAGAVAAGFSLIGSAEPTVVTADPSNILGADPQLGPLANNGGPTQTLMPDPLSPVVDAGVAGSLSTDQRGFARTDDAPTANPAGGDGTDIGAVEVQIGGPPPDTTPPETTIDTTPPPSSSEGPYAFAFSADEAGSTFECSLDGAAFAACTSPVTYPTLGEGSHTFRVRATDAANNVDTTPASYTFAVVAAPPPAGDTTAPETELTRTPKRIIKARRDTRASFTFEFTGSDDVSPAAKLGFECRLGKHAFESCSSPYFGSVLQGRHTFSVRAVDEAGNRDATPATFSFRKKTPKRHGSGGGGDGKRHARRC